MQEKEDKEKIPHISYAKAWVIKPFSVAAQNGEEGGQEEAKETEYVKGSGSVCTNKNASCVLQIIVLFGAAAQKSSEKMTYWQKKGQADNPKFGHG